MRQPVFRGVSQSLIHAPDMLYSYGAVPVMERLAHPGGEYARQLPRHLRPYDTAVDYAPYQAYVGRISPCEAPGYDPLTGGERFGPYGEIMPEIEFLALMRLADRENLLVLEAEFAADAQYRLADHPLFAGRFLGAGRPLSELQDLIDAGRGLPLYSGARVAAVFTGDQAGMEALVTRAGAELAFRHLVSRSGLQDEELHRIDCTEASFMTTLLDAVEAVSAGIHKNAAVVVGNPPADLGRHSPGEVADNRPVSEDAIAVWAVHISEDDFISPRISVAPGAEMAGETDRPLLWSLRDRIMAGHLDRWIMTARDGRQAVLERNPGLQVNQAPRTRIGVTTFGGDRGPEEVVRAAELAQQRRPDLEVVLLGDPGVPTTLEVAAATVIGPAHREMERRLQAGDLQAAVTVRYAYPPATAMVERARVAGMQESFLVTVPCAAAAERAEMLVRGAVFGVAVARTLGHVQPVVDLVSLEDGRQAERTLKELQKSGWNVGIGSGGKPAEVLVTDRCDPKSYAGVGVGEGPRILVCTVKPSAEAEAIAEAIGFAGDLVGGDLEQSLAAELAQARRAGLEQLLGRAVVV